MPAKNVTDQNENPFELARQLSRTRSVTLDNVYRRRSNINAKEKHHRSRLISENSESEKIPKSDLYYFQHPNMILPDKITEWMKNTESELKNEKPEYNRNLSGNSEHSVTSERSYHSHHSRTESDTGEHSDNELFGIKESELPDVLLTECRESFSNLADVKWNVKNCDLLLDIEGVLLPIDKNFVSGISESFQLLIKDRIGKNEAVMIELNDYDMDEIKTVLEWIYSVNDEVVSDENVASLLQLGDEFKVERLKIQCEEHLKNSETFNPLIMSHLAKQYRLDSLLDHSHLEMSKIDGIEDTKEFKLLDTASQNKILKCILRRYKQASKTLSQVDVHLCSHHGNDPKSNQCCFRAATYSTENDRTFLVQMENPEEKLIQRFQEAFNGDLE